MNPALLFVEGRWGFAIVEVKAANAEDRAMASDLVKLARFRREYEYRAAYFFVYGAGTEWWSANADTMFENAKREAVKNGEGFDQSMLCCFVHERPRERAIRVH